MPASLAEQLYHRWRRAQHDITAHPAWGNLDSEQRAAWGEVALAAGDVEKQNRAEQQATEAAIELDVIANLNTAIQKLQAENEQLTRQRDEAQRAVREGFPATVAVIRQQRDVAQAEVEKWRIDVGRLVNELHQQREGESIVDCALRTVATLRQHNVERAKEITGLKAEVTRLKAEATEYR